MNEAPDWSRRGQGFRQLTENDYSIPPRVTTPAPLRVAANIEAWRSAPFVVRELNRAARIGFFWGAGITTLITMILLAAMGIHP